MISPNPMEERSAFWATPAAASTCWVAWPSPDGPLAAPSSPPADGPPPWPGGDIGVGVGNEGFGVGVGVWQFGQLILAWLLFRLLEMPTLALQSPVLIDPFPPVLPLALFCPELQLTSTLLLTFDWLLWLILVWSEDSTLTWFWLPAALSLIVTLVA